LVSSSFSQTVSINRSWAEELLFNHTGYFSDAYEKNIFNIFKKKFPKARIKDFVFYEQKNFVELTLEIDKKAYVLVIELDGKGKVKGVQRKILDMVLKKDSTVEQLVFKWLGKFLYRIDAGDDESIYDLIFHADTRISYKKIKSKKEIIKHLKADFPRYIQPFQINLEELPSSFLVQISIHLAEDIYLEISNTLANITNTDELQESLYKKIASDILSVNSDDPSNLITSKKQLIDYLSDYYIHARMDLDTLIIPYPRQGIKELKQMKYLIADKGAKINIDPILYLNEKRKGTLMINDAYPVSSYRSDSGESNDLSELRNALKLMYRMFLLEIKSRAVKNDTDISGIVNYRGYEKHQIRLNNRQQWIHFLHSLRKEGAFYFYPSKLDYRGQIIIHGLLYVVNENSLNFYHFGEVITKFSESDEKLKMNIELSLYPFLSRFGVSKFEENYKNCY
jgi:hypothetical protein